MQSYKIILILYHFSYKICDYLTFYIISHIIYRHLCQYLTLKGINLTQIYLIIIHNGFSEKTPETLMVSKIPPIYDLIRRYLAVNRLVKYCSTYKKPSFSAIVLKKLQILLAVQGKIPNFVPEKGIKPCKTGQGIVIIAIFVPKT